MSFDYPRLLGRLVNRPLLVTPQKAEQLLAVLAPRAGHHGVRVQRAEADEDGPVLLSDLSASAWERGESRAYHVVNGIAVIPATGTLVAKLGTLDPYCGMTGYDGLSAKLELAESDPYIRGILLDCDSPGGEVHSSLMDAARMIRTASKPVWASCSDIAYSAMFWLASQAERLILPQCGGVGSVGVVVLHADFSRAMEKDGITVTMIHAGAHKVDGNPYQPLPEAVRGDIQAEIEALRHQFAAAVADGRGIDVKAVLASEARCLTADEAIAAGFADEILSPSDVLAAFAEHLSTTAAPAASTAKGKPMAPKAAAKPAGKSRRAVKKPAARRAEMPAEEEDCEAEEEEPETEGEEEPEAEDEDEPEVEDEEEPEAEDKEKSPQATAAFRRGAKAERAKWAAVMGAKQVKGREATAVALLSGGTLSAKAILATLDTLPKMSGSFASRMAAEPNAEVGHGGGGKSTPGGSLAAACAAKNTALKGARK